MSSKQIVPTKTPDDYFLEIKGILNDAKQKNNTKIIFDDINKVNKILKNLYGGDRKMFTFRDILNGAYNEIKEYGDDVSSDKEKIKSILENLLTGIKKLMGIGNDYDSLAKIPKTEKQIKQDSSVDWFNVYHPNTKIGTLGGKRRRSRKNKTRGRKRKTRSRSHK